MTKDERRTFEMAVHEFSYCAYFSTLDFHRLLKILHTYIHELEANQDRHEKMRTQKRLVANGRKKMRYVCPKGHGGYTLG
jgi:hypothetical protein